MLVFRGGGKGTGGSQGTFRVKLGLWLTLGKAFTRKIFFSILLSILLLFFFFFLIKT